MWSVYVGKHHRSTFDTRFWTHTDVMQSALSKPYAFCLLSASISSQLARQTGISSIDTLPAQMLTWT